MSKTNNVLVDLRNKVGIAGKKQPANSIETDADIAGRSDKAVKFNIPTIANGG